MRACHNGHGGCSVPEVIHKGSFPQVELKWTRQGGKEDSELQQKCVGACTLCDMQQGRQLYGNWGED
eukprot:1158617-Pelagomonas_calceolata.AAC.10